MLPPFVGRWNIIFIMDAMSRTCKKNILFTIRVIPIRKLYIYIVSLELKGAIFIDMHFKFASRLVVISGRGVFGFLSYIVV